MLTILTQSLLVFTIIIIIILQTRLLIYKKKHDYIKNRRYILIITSIFFLLSTTIITLLLKSHLISDYSVYTVYTNGHSTQPLLYKICGLWGNHEGSMLLWVWILSIYTYTLLLLRNIPYDLLKWSIINQYFFNFFFIFYTFITSNPFITKIIQISDGKELNPILQDIVLSIHPPLIYLGYIGLSIPFSLTIGYLKTDAKYHTVWCNYVRIYNLIACFFLTLGILLGSWWAYYELGWGGWWFWDPVENASLLPWIISISLMHCIINTQKKHYTVKWTIILSFAAFYSSILGTFFVRSGFLDSVHSFAADSNRGFFILSFLCILFLYTTIVYTKYLRYVQIQEINTFNSREGVIFLNQVFFSCFYIIVSVGTFYPILYDYIFKKSITIGPSFYNQAIIPLLIPFLFLIGYSFMTHWSTLLKQHHYATKIIYIILTIFSAIFIIYINEYQGPIILYILIIPIFYVVLHLFLNLKIIIQNFTIQTIVSHLGFILLILGITLWFCFYRENHHIMYPGDRYLIGDVEYLFRGINVLKGPNYDSYYGSYLILKNDNIVGMLFPEKRHYYVQDFYTSKVDIHTNFFYDIHSIIGDGNIYTGWATSTYMYPSMSWIWLGGLTVVVGLAISIYQLRKCHLQKVF